MVYKNIRNILVLVLITVWLAVFSVDNKLHIISCNVGQGDATLIQKGTMQILIDGGPDNSVLTCLGKHMPFWDRKIEMVILTHPQADHYSGLIDVIKNYEVLNFAENKSDFSNQGYKVLRNEVGGQGINRLILSKGMTIRAGMIYLDILHPLDNLESKDINNDGVVTLLRYAQIKALFTADVENKVSDELSLIPEIQHLEYIKVNHHGSKNGLSEKLLQAIMPKVAVISAAKKNSYGHPHIEILNLLEKYNVEVLRTDKIGDIDIKY